MRKCRFFPIYSMFHSNTYKIIIYNTLNIPNLTLPMKYLLNHSCGGNFNYFLFQTFTSNLTINSLEKNFSKVANFKYRPLSVAPHKNLQSNSAKMKIWVDSCNKIKNEAN